MRSHLKEFWLVWIMSITIYHLSIINMNIALTLQTVCMSLRTLGDSGPHVKDWISEQVVWLDLNSTHPFLPWVEARPPPQPKSQGATGIQPLNPWKWEKNDYVIWSRGRPLWRHSSRSRPGFHKHTLPVLSGSPLCVGLLLLLLLENKFFEDRHCLACLYFYPECLSKCQAHSKWLINALTFVSSSTNINRYKIYSKSFGGPERVQKSLM